MARHEECEDKTCDDELPDAMMLHLPRGRSDYEVGDVAPLPSHCCHETGVNEAPSGVFHQQHLPQYFGVRAEVGAGQGIYRGDAEAPQQRKKEELQPFVIGAANAKVLAFFSPGQLGATVEELSGVVLVAAKLLLTVSAKKFLSQALLIGQHRIRR